ncbi:hypothetical protein LG290_07755 [Halomonas sediminis]
MAQPQAVLEHAGFQIATNQAQHPLVAEAARDPGHQQFVAHPVEEGFQIEVNHPAVPGSDVDFIAETACWTLRLGR